MNGKVAKKSQFFRLILPNPLPPELLISQALLVLLYAVVPLLIVQSSNSRVVLECTQQTPKVSLVGANTPLIFTLLIFTWHAKEAAPALTCKKRRGLVGMVWHCSVSMVQ